MVLSDDDLDGIVDWYRQLAQIMLWPGESIDSLVPEVWDGSANHDSGDDQYDSDDQYDAKWLRAC